MWVIVGRRYFSYRRFRKSLNASGWSERIVSSLQIARASSALSPHHCLFRSLWLPCQFRQYYLFSRLCCISCSDLLSMLSLLTVGAAVSSLDTVIIDTFRPFPSVNVISSTTPFDKKISAVYSFNVGAISVPLTVIVLVVWLLRCVWVFIYKKIRTHQTNKQTKKMDILTSLDISSLLGVESPPPSDVSS